MKPSSLTTQAIRTGRHLFCLGVVASSLLLTGCVATPPSGLHVEAPLTGEEGAFLVRVVPNAPTAGRYFKNWADLLVVSVKPDGSDGTPYKIPASLDASSRSALFVASMPPGRYRLAELSSASYVSMVQKAQWIDVGARFPRFEIHAGQLTDLGAVVQTAALGSGNGVELGYDAMPDHEIAGDLVRELAPRLVPLLGKPFLSWSTDTARAAARSTDGLASFTSIGIADPHVLADGRLIAGSYDGMVKTGMPGRSADLHDIGQRVSVESVAVLPDASWVAAGEYGVIRLSRDGGSSWRSIRGDLPYGLVCSVDTVAGQLVATVLRGNRAVVASTILGAESPAHWTVRATYLLKSGPFWQSASGYATRSFIVGDQVVTAMPTDFIGIWNSKTDQTIERKLPDTVERFAAPGGNALRFMSAAVMFANVTYISNDVGATWEKLPTLPFVWGVALGNPSKGVGWAPGLQVRTGNFLKTADGGRTWVKSREQGLAVPQIILDEARGVAYAIDIGGGLWIGTEDATNWARTVF
jgi:hypothetical protein